jgi:2-polyprenyl-6-hydroxyphenyl methylase/3-demethylubiquinone-9 3-methyltransferase
MAAPAKSDVERKSERFAFGKNWRRFLKSVDADVVQRAKRSLCEMLEVEDLVGKSFLDVGSGSGLFSLAARQLGARAHSFDVDLQSVRCAEELKRRFSPGQADEQWVIEQGSVIDKEFLRPLGRFDIVYSWGVLHHTGQMWQALENTVALVAPGGILFVAIYNDQGRGSLRWKRIKRWYNVVPLPLRWLILWTALVRIWGPTTIRDILRGKPFHTWKNYAQNSRGMSPWHDLVDWVGGYPFEVAKPEEVMDFCRERGLQLLRWKTCGGGRGCNEYVFARSE